MKTFEIVTENGGAKVHVSVELDQELIEAFRIKGMVDLTPEKFEALIVKLVEVALEQERQLFKLEKKESEIKPITP